MLAASGSRLVELEHRIRIRCRLDGVIPARPIGHRSGYTLLEIMLAMSVLLALTALSWPPLMRVYADFRVREATEDVRKTAAGTRILAIDQDVTFQFLYEPGGRQFVRLPYDVASTDSSSDRSSQTTTPITGQISGQLPEGMTFTTVSGTVGGQLSQDALNGLGLSGELTRVSWSAPILFYPDGTATFAVFEVNDLQSSTRRVSVRDLSGAVSVANRSQ